MKAKIMADVDPKAVARRLRAIMRDLDPEAGH
jgi:hypothetical protein